MVSRRCSSQPITHRLHRARQQGPKRTLIRPAVTTGHAQLVKMNLIIKDKNTGSLIAFQCLQMRKADGFPPAFSRI